jgi:hypothetical protein
VERVALLLVLAAVAVLVAWLVGRRTKAPAPAPTNWEVPAQLDRADFDRPDAPWLVAVFSSSTCLSCQGTLAKAEQLESEQVAVQEIEAVRDKALHERYRVDAVPMLLVADHEGVVRGHFLGEPTATDLWATVAEIREPGSTPDGCDHGVG